MEFKISSSSEEQFEHFFKSNYARFPEDFKVMSENTHYSHKLYTKSIRYECWDEENLIGVLCAYLNDKESFVYIPYLCVCVDFSGHGIASNLMQQLIHDVNSKYDHIDLEVRRRNASACLFYKKNGFYEVSSNVIKVQLRKDLIYEKNRYRKF